MKLRKLREYLGYTFEYRHSTSMKGQKNPLEFKSRFFSFPSFKIPWNAKWHTLASFPSSKIASNSKLHCSVSLRLKSLRMQNFIGGFSFAWNPFENSHCSVSFRIQNSKTMFSSSKIPSNSKLHCSISLPVKIVQNTKLHRWISLHLKFRRLKGFFLKIPWCRQNFGRQEIRLEPD